MMYIKNVINLNLKLPPRNMIYLLSYYTKQSEKTEECNGSKNNYGKFWFTYSLELTRSPINVRVLHELISHQCKWSFHLYPTIMMKNYIYTFLRILCIWRVVGHDVIMDRIIHVIFLVPGKAEAWHWWIRYLAHGYFELECRM